LDRRAPRDEALGVVREICGLHAQVMSSAELTLWARVEELKAVFVPIPERRKRPAVERWKRPLRYHRRTAPF
jgi:hypothetical protein